MNDNTCERCNKELDAERGAIPVTYGETDITICYPCAVELTYLIGTWLNSEPLDNPHKEDDMTWLPGVGLVPLP